MYISFLLKIYLTIKIGGKTIINKKYATFAILFLLMLTLTITIVSATEDNDTTDTHKIQQQANITKEIKTANTTKKDPKIRFNNVTSKVYQSTTLKAQLPKDATGKVVFKVDSKSITNPIRIVNGSVKYTFKPEYRSNNWTLTLVYSGNEKYNPARINATLDLRKLNVTTKIQTTNARQNQPTQIKVKVIDEQKNPLFVKVAYKINRKTIGTANTDTNGIATLNYTFNNSYTKNNYELLVKTGDTYRHSASNSTKNFTLLLEPIISIEKVNAKVGENITLKSKVTDTKNKPVHNGTVNYYIDNKLIAKSNITNGKDECNVNVGLITPGQHNLTIRYVGNSKYYTSNNTTTITINKQNSRIIAAQTRGITTANTTTINATIITANNKTISNGQATLIVNNKKISTANVKNSRVVFNYTAPKQDSSNTISYKIVYNNSQYYNPTEFNGKINIHAYKKVYVSANGNDSNNGNKTNPFKTIKKAVNIAFENATIYINPGVYNESSIFIQKSLRIAPQSTKDKTIINLQGQGNTLFNVYNQNATVYISNMTIKNSKIENKNYSACILNIGKLCLDNIQFTNNTARGLQTSSCIYNTGQLEIKNSLFNNNQAYDTEGATIKSNGGLLKITNSQFDNNKLNGNNIAAAAIYAYNTNTIINKTSFNNNIVTGTNVSSGAIKTVRGNITLENTKLSNNQANGNGLIIGGAITSLNTKINMKNDTFENNRVTSNQTAYAGALFDQNSILNIKNSTFKSNTIKGINGYGGAIFTYNTTITLENSNILSNNITANTKSGNAYGAGLYINQGQLTSNNNTLSSNRLLAKVAYGGAIFTTGKLTITKTLIKDNQANATSAAGGAIFSSANTTISSTSFEQNMALGKSNGGGAIANTGNLSVTYSNFMGNRASAGGNAISNSGTVLNINNNYWNAKYPTWSKALNKVTKPSKYSKTKITI